MSNKSIWRFQYSLGSLIVACSAVVAFTLLVAGWTRNPELRRAVEVLQAKDVKNAAEERELFQLIALHSLTIELSFQNQHGSRLNPSEVHAGDIVYINADGYQIKYQLLSLNNLAELMRE